MKVPLIDADMPARARRRRIGATDDARGAGPRAQAVADLGPVVRCGAKGVDVRATIGTRDSCRGRCARPLAGGAVYDGGRGGSGSATIRRIDGAEQLDGRALQPGRRRGRYNVATFAVRRTRIARRPSGPAQSIISVSSDALAIAERADDASSACAHAVQPVGNAVASTVVADVRRDRLAVRD